MDLLIDVILRAGRSAVELSFFILLPVMIVMVSLMRLLEARGVLDWVVARITPALRPLGLTGLGGFAALQINFVSFAAPVATLAMMDQRGASSRHLAATLAMVLAMAQANVSMPMAAMGLQFGPLLAWSVVGGLVAAAVTYYVFGRGLSNAEETVDETLHHPVAESAKGVLDVINRAGAEAFKIAVGALPMLVLSLTVVLALRRLGALDLLTELLSPALLAIGADPALLLQPASGGAVDSYFLSNDLDPNGSYAMFVLRPWKNLSGHLQAIVDAAIYVNQKHGLTPVFVPIEFPSDLMPAERVGALLHCPWHAVRTRQPIEVTIGILSRMKTVVGIRLHSLMFSAGQGVPVVGMSYDIKVDGFLKYIGSRTCLQLSSVKAEPLCRLIDECVSGALDNEVHRTAEMLRERESENVKGAAKLLNISEN